MGFVDSHVLEPLEVRPSTPDPRDLGQRGAGELTERMKEKIVDDGVSKIDTHEAR